MTNERWSEVKNGLHFVFRTRKGVLTPFPDVMFEDVLEDE